LQTDSTYTGDCRESVIGITTRRTRAEMYGA